MMSDEIDATHSVVVAATLVSASRSPRASTPVPTINLADGSIADDHSAYDNRKQPFETLQSRLTPTRPSPSSNINASPNHFTSIGTKLKTSKNKRQQKIWDGAPNPEASMEMNSAVADLIHSNVLLFPLGRA